MPEGVKVLSVSEVTLAIKGLLEDAFPMVWVTGEISNFKRHSSGHLYLTLKDSGAQLRAVMWRSDALALPFEPVDGMEIIARGSIGVYEPKGDYQFYIKGLQPKGIGALELALRLLKEKLAKLGYFAPQRKKPLPGFPRRVGLVTSPTGAAIRDMLEILGRRWPFLEVWVCPVRVQGESAGREIAEAVHLLNRVGGIDVMIVGRGGGSSENLWAFNEEAVAQAIFLSRIPVVSAVGHEIDVTIADLVADCRALTPSEAAELITPDRKELLEGVHNLERKLRLGLLQRLDLARTRMENLAQRRIFLQPLERIRDHERKLDDWSDRGNRAVRQWLVRARDQVGAWAARLESLSPLNVLGRGYSLTRRETDLAVIRSPEQIHPGDRLVTHVQHGRIFSRVEEEVPAEPPSL